MTPDWLATRVRFWTARYPKRGFGIEWGQGQVQIHLWRRVFLWSKR